MSQDYGREAPRAHQAGLHRERTRYLVVIDGGGVTVARLFGHGREALGDFDAGTEEVATMIKGLTPAVGATGAEWDRVLEGHSASERAAARIYTLDV
jgi:hypothetical protein